MSLSSKLVRILCVAIAAVVVLPVAVSSSYAQEQEEEQQQWKLFTTAPENVRTVWFLQARHVASELELDREAARQLTRTYITARQEHREKVEALPQTRESMRERWQIRREATSSLEESLVEALGEERGNKAALALGGFSFLTDNMAADVLSAQREALGALFKYQENVNKAVREARESGSWEGMRDKFLQLLEGLAERASAIYSQKKNAEWQQKYGPIFERLLSR